jgi:hypothetical protein
MIQGGTRLTLHFNECVAVDGTAGGGDGVLFMPFRLPCFEVGGFFKSSNFKTETFIGGHTLPPHVYPEDPRGCSLF